MPDAEGNPLEQSGAVPYTLTSSYCTHPEVYGKAGRAWLTGTQTWMMATLVEGLAGLRPDYGGMHIEPSFPTTWDGLELYWRRREDSYHITIRRAGEVRKEHASSIRILVNGIPQEKNWIPYCSDGEQTEIELFLE
jgi:cellobiose phosphorylase